MSDTLALRTVLAHVQENLDDWRQDEWSNCFAGQALRLLAGATELRGDCGCGCNEIRGLAVASEKLYGYFIGIKAAQLLELTPHQAERLFNGDNTLVDLARLIGEFTAEEADQPQVTLVA